MTNFGAAARFPFEALFEINLRCLELMVEAAKAPSCGMHPLLSRIHEPLLEMTPAALERIAQSRFLLVDMRFNDVQFWTAVSSSSQRVGRRSLRMNPIFPQRGAATLARSTMTFSWHALLASPEIGAVTLGVHREVAQAVAAMRIADLERVARHHYLELMPRWLDHTSVWLGLLDAALHADLSAMKVRTLHCLQLAAVGD